ncbi:helix-hairpin-helix domain-containing protein [Bacillus sp. V59.32b]|uniref:helix-hairpin-helix domain-containing protein n=1 Tax=Bacillus sp. V59.32b TaxID=1758642 RepID=UPI000E3DA8D1|nr:Pathogenicity locus [Bacillus sp. V59.32b]
MDLSELSRCLQSTERARYLQALAQFQAIHSIGPKLAQMVIELGYYSLEEIKGEEGAELLNRLEAKIGHWEDPCVEDSLRCVVHHANHPGSDKSWWHFTVERKAYREQYGYPATRPTIPWYEAKDK